MVARKQGEMAVPMPDRKAYNRRMTALSAWTIKATLLVVAGAVTVVVAMTIIRNVSLKPDVAQGGKFIGVRHEGAAIAPPGEIQPGVSGSDLATASPSEGGALLRNGITVLSPKLLVPVIDLESLQTAKASDDNASVNKGSEARKRPRYAKRSQAQRRSRAVAKRWKAYGLAIR